MYNSFSVLMSVYKDDNTKFLNESLSSIFSQGILPNEVILVIDGNIQMDMQNLLDEFHAKYSILKIVKNNENRGLGYSLKLGTQYCNSDYIFRMDADDICTEDRFIKTLQFIKANREIDIIGSYVYEFIDDPKLALSIRKVPIDYHDIYKFSKRRSPFNHPTVAIKRDSLINAGGYSDLKRNQDLELFGRMMHMGYKGMNIPECLVYYRVNPNQLARRKSYKNAKLYISVIYGFYKIKHSTFFDLLAVFISQLTLFILPSPFIKIIDKLFLRSKK